MMSVVSKLTLVMRSSELDKQENPACAIFGQHRHIWLLQNNASRRDLKIGTTQRDVERMS